jgi:hypothetical protein
LKVHAAATFNQLLRDGSMPLMGRDVERCGTILQLKIDITASCNELFRLGRILIYGREVHRRVSILQLKIDVTMTVTASSDEPFRCGLLPVTCLFFPYQRGDAGVSHALSNLQRSSAILILKIDVTASCNELLSDDFKPICGREVERR